MNTQKKLLLKPHHFLDIMKLYGAGVNYFTPDLRYGHDFYRVWNKTIDRRILDAMGLNEGDEMTAIAFAALAQEKLTPQIIFEVWNERPKEETEKRIANLHKGLNKFLDSNNNV